MGIKVYSVYWVMQGCRMYIINRTPQQTFLSMVPYYDFLLEVLERVG